MILIIYTLSNSYLRFQTILTPRFHVSMFLVLKKRK
jgi:hypothetical protein